MNLKTGRLVDHQKVPVLVYDVQLHGFRSECDGDRIRYLQHYLLVQTYTV